MLVTDGLLQPSRADRPIPPTRSTPGRAAADRGGLVEIRGSTVRTARARPGLVGVAVVGLPEHDDLPSVLRVARAHTIRATWFVTGHDVARRHGDVAAIRRAGFELGVLGYTGRDLRDLPPSRIRLELSTTQATLAAEEGIVAPLLLLPGANSTTALDGDALRVARTAGDAGYLVVATAPPDDVSPSAVHLVDLRESADPASRLAHAGDGGTTASVSGAIGLRPSDANQVASLGTRLNGRVAVLAIRASAIVVRALHLLFLPITLLVVARAVLAVLLAGVHAGRRRRRRRAGRDPRWTGPVTVIVPAFNEEAGIAAALRSFHASDWPAGLEIIVVDDGSTDGTAAAVQRLALPGVRLVTTPNRGKPAALNVGIDLATTEVVVCVDGDTLFQPDTIGELVQPFVDERVGAVSGNAKVLNRGSLLGRWQHIEYVMGFNLDRRLLDLAGAIPTVPGAVGAFRRRALLDVGGVSEDTIAEDTDLTIAIARRGWRVVFEPRAIAWTEAPSSVGDLWRQRYRWSYGTLQAAWKHRHAFLEPRPIGPIGLTYALVFQVLLALLGPVLDVTALHARITGDERIVAIWLAFVCGQVALAAFAFLLDGESLRPLWTVPVQQVVYRQLMYLVVIQSVAAAFAGTRLRWHKLRRDGLDGHTAAWTPPPADQAVRGRRRSMARDARSPTTAPTAVPTAAPPVSENPTMAPTAIDP
jgi:cellulose synthase/poly-beta-1,6-N-acetylglucosamine synthase-like glycosyltransferase